MSLLVMSTESTPSKDRLSSGWVRRSLSPFSKISTPKTESRPSTSNGLLSPRPDSSRSNSDDSRSARSSKSGTRRPSFLGVVNRLRSSSSASSLGGKAQEGGDINDIHDWFQGFRRYNQIVTTQATANGSYDSQSFAKTTKPLTKNCGGQLLHGLPERAFDFALLWCPAGEIAQQDSEEPSWSWTAYDGVTNYPFDPSTCPDLYAAPRSEGELFRSEIVHFTVGPQNAQCTVRREKDSLLRSKYPSYFHAPWGSKPSVDSDTLRFTASTIPADGFRAEALQHQGKEIPCSHLLDDKDQHCGVIMDFESVISKPSSVPGTYEFVALSRNLRRSEPAPHSRRAANPTIHPMGTPIWDGERFVWDEVVSDFDMNVFEEGPWKMINVMLIKWVGEHAERIAIARIHEDAWLAKKPVRKDVVLR
ncbi:hypothetical protein CC86DRAFT_284437 [Ophiobolus disseminans]|uniref:Uncharacterized protein n=1 Tax=Ophiobolus disseminans TaxID=1469910 RepID=A0A6A7ADP6_9PLEO|nr:hypothetical protein CC86DRAFT_284437 [Ophiobolus disseminans]